MQQDDAEDAAACSSSSTHHRQREVLSEQDSVLLSGAASSVKPTVWMESSFVGAKPGSSAAGSPPPVGLGEYIHSVGITL